MKSFRFLHLSDLHFRIRYEPWGFQNLLSSLPDSLKNLMLCLKKEKEQGLNFVLLTGDLSHDGTKEDYEALRSTLNRILDGIPWAALPGNHDNRAAFAALTGEPETPHNWDGTVTADGFRIITMDSGCGVSGCFSRSQIEWLKQVLSVPSERGSILAVHHPLIPGQEGLDGIQTDPCFPDLIAQSDIIGIFCGHTHRNYAGTFAGKPYFTADSLSYSMEESGPNTYVKALAAYNRVVYWDGVLSVQVRQLAPKPLVAACFSTDTMSTLFQKRK